MYRIAIVTNDHHTICAHFGRASYYEVFAIEKGKILQHETRSKPAHNQFVNEPHDEPGYAHGQGPTAESRHIRMLDPIRDCQVLLAGGMGQGAFDNLKRINIQPILADIMEIDQAVKAYLDGQLVNHLEWLH